MFDLQRTQTALAADQAGTQVDGLQALANSMVVPNLISALDGSQILITEKEFVMTTKDGNGKAYTYTFMEAPDADTVRLKMSDGEVNTFHREGDRFWLTSTGNVKIRAYYQRAGH